MVDSMAEKIPPRAERTRQESMAVPKKTYGRRKFLSTLGKVAKLGTVGAVLGPLTGLTTLSVADTVDSAVDFQRAPKTPTEVYKGETEIKRGVSIRLTPDITDENEIPNTVNWDDIRFTPHISTDKDRGLYKSKSFTMEDPLILTKKDGTKWIMWYTFLTRRVATQPTFLYLKIGPETADFVKLKPGGKFIKITATTQGYKTEDGYIYNPGRVTQVNR